MTKPNWDDWNAWAAGHVKTGIDAALEQFAGVMGEEVAEITKTQNAKIRDLELTVIGLRAELNRLSEPSRSSVVPMSRKRDPFWAPLAIHSPLGVTDTQVALGPRVREI